MAKFINESNELLHLKGNPCFKVSFSIIESRFNSTIVGAPNYLCCRFHNFIQNLCPRQVASLSIVKLLLFKSNATGLGYIRSMTPLITENTWLQNYHLTNQSKTGLLEIRLSLSIIKHHNVSRSLLTK